MAAQDIGEALQDVERLLESSKTILSDLTPHEVANVLGEPHNPTSGASAAARRRARSPAREHANRTLRVASSPIGAECRLR